MFEASKLFLCCLNMWKFETPTSFNKRLTSGEPGTTELTTETHQKMSALYKLNYTRWMCYNFVPSFCETFEKHETVMVFGISFLKLVFALIRQELQEKFSHEKDKVPHEKRTLVWTYLPKFLNAVQEELDDETSQNWLQNTGFSHSFSIYEAEIYSKFDIFRPLATHQDGSFHVLRLFRHAEGRASPQPVQHQLGYGQHGQYRSE